MEDIQKLIGQILSDSKLAQSKNASSSVYRDEPILKTAAQIITHTPPKYREMRKLAKSYDAFEQNSAKVFYQQGKFMENHEDDFEYHGDFVRYFPTYQSMSDLQLRGYFSWRTKVRHGIMEKTSLSFVFVYIYELLNQIGVSSPEEGFYTLMSFWEGYRELDNHISLYMKTWLHDYIVYNNLDKSLLECFADGKFDDAVLTLLNYKSNSMEAVFSALNSLSSYNLMNSRFYKQFPDDMNHVVYHVFSALSDYYNKNRKNGLCEKYFGRIYTDHYTMFRSAVFYQQAAHKDFVYEINDIYKYRCKNGIWTRKRFFFYGEKNKQIGALLKTIDFLMRQKYEFKSTLKTGKTTKLILNIANKEIDKYLETKKRNSLPKIEIDVSKLQTIRTAALETQTKLIVDEDREEPAFPEPAAVQRPQALEPHVLEPEEEDITITGIESRFLKCLLYGKAYDELIRANGLMLSVLVDTVNEKLYDRFSDTVIIFTGDKPELIDDYIDELKGIFSE